MSAPSLLVFGDSNLRGLESVLMMYGEDPYCYCFPGLTARDAEEQWELLQGLPNKVDKIIVWLGTNDVSAGRSAKAIVHDVKAVTRRMYTRYHVPIFYISPIPRHDNNLEQILEERELRQEDLDGSRAAETALIPGEWGEDRHTVLLNYGTEMNPEENIEYYRRAVVANASRDEVHLSPEGQEAIWGSVLRDMHNFMTGQEPQAIESLWIPTILTPSSQRFHLVNGEERANKRRRM